MSFAARLAAHYAVAKTKLFAEQGSLQLKAERLAEVVGDKKPPITHAGLQDGWERAIKNGLPYDEAKRLMAVTYKRGFETLVNDAAQYTEKLGQFKGEIQELQRELKTRAIFEEIKRLVRKQMGEKLNEQQIEIVAREVRAYSSEICAFIEGALVKALHGAHSTAGRAVGFAQFHAAIDAFLAMESKTLEPLNSFDPNG